jgi:dienelactone hydrolase/cytochrome c556
MFGLSVLLLLQTSLSTPFLDQFSHRETTPPAAEQAVQIDAGGRSIAAFLVTPAAPAGRLPAVLLVSGREGLTGSLKQFARETAGIGYVTLAVEYRGDQDLDGSPLLREILGRSDDLAAAAAWLAAQPAVDPDRIGAIGWNAAFDAVTRLAQARKVTAVYPSRIDSQVGMTDQMWVDIYEFFGHRVEDARAALPPSQADLPIARIVDIMRAIMSDQGVRGRLAHTLAVPPPGDAEWEQARADAAMVAEGGMLLLAERPPKGSPVGWRQRAADFRAAAQTLLRAVDARDFAAAQQSFRELPRVCAACHADYR